VDALICWCPSSIGAESSGSPTRARGSTPPAGQCPGQCFRGCDRCAAPRS
jgi:hypothetical protein